MGGDRRCHSPHIHPHSCPCQAGDTRSGPKLKLEAPCRCSTDPYLGQEPNKHPTETSSRTDIVPHAPDAKVLAITSATEPLRTAQLRVTSPQRAAKECVESQATSLALPTDRPTASREIRPGLACTWIRDRGPHQLLPTGGVGSRPSFPARTA